MACAAELVIPLSALWKSDARAIMLCANIVCCTISQGWCCDAPGLFRWCGVGCYFALGIVFCGGPGFCVAPAEATFFQNHKVVGVVGEFAGQKKQTPSETTFVVGVCRVNRIRGHKSHEQTLLWSRAVGHTGIRAKKNTKHHFWTMRASRLKDFCAALRPVETILAPPISGAEPQNTKPTGIVQSLSLSGGHGFGADTSRVWDSRPAEQSPDRTRSPGTARRSAMVQPS